MASMRMFNNILSCRKHLSKIFSESILDIYGKMIFITVCFMGENYIHAQPQG